MTIAEALAAYAPKRGVGIEIGVGDGDTSLSLLLHAQPSVFHFLDCWEHQEHEVYPDGFNVPQDKQNERFAKAKARIEEAARRTPTHCHRVFSLRGAGLLKNHRFDWIYLDANHSYEAVRDDLAAWWPLLKPGGVLFAHDYCTKVAYFGVVQAVGEFMDRHPEAKLLAVSEETFPVAVIEKT